MDCCEWLCGPYVRCCLCCCPSNRSCWWCECCACSECCCEMESEKDPLLRGRELKKRVDGRESQELEYHFTPSSSEPSTPWESERGSETSEYPIQALKELQMDVTVPGQGPDQIPSTGQMHVSDQPATGPTWKLLPAQATDTPQEVMLVQPSPARGKTERDH